MQLEVTKGRKEDKRIQIYHQSIFYLRGKPLRRGFVLIHSHLRQEWLGSRKISNLDIMIFHPSYFSRNKCISDCRGEKDGEYPPGPGSYGLMNRPGKTPPFVLPFAECLQTVGLGGHHPTLIWDIEI